MQQVLEGISSLSEPVKSLWHLSPVKESPPLRKHDGACERSPEEKRQFFRLISLCCAQTLACWLQQKQVLKCSSHLPRNLRDCYSLHIRPDPWNWNQEGNQIAQTEVSSGVDLNPNNGGYAREAHPSTNNSLQSNAYPTIFPGLLEIFRNRYGGKTWETTGVPILLSADKPLFGKILEAKTSRRAVK